MKNFYSPYINRFIQPDSIIPNPADPQSFNRYAYVRNNPIRYTDPTGHFQVDDDTSSCLGDHCASSEEIGKLFNRGQKLRKFKEENGCAFISPLGQCISSGGGYIDIADKYIPGFSPSLPGEIIPGPTDFDGEGGRWNPNLPPEFPYPDNLGAPFFWFNTPQEIFDRFNGMGTNTTPLTPGSLRLLRSLALGPDPILLERGTYLSLDESQDWGIYIETNIASGPYVNKNGNNYYPIVSQVGDSVALKYSTDPYGRSIVTKWTSIFQLLYVSK